MQVFDIDVAKRRDQAGIVLENIFNLTDLDLLKWYLESYLDFPIGASEVRARKVEALLTTIGNRLNKFANVCPDGPSEGGVYARIVSEDPAEQALPWELMTHGNDPASGLAGVLRGIDNKLELDSSCEPLRVLLAVCRPAGEWDVPALTVAKPILALKLRGIEVGFLHPPTLENLNAALKSAETEGRPYTVVHLDTHGLQGPNGDFHIVLENEWGGSCFASVAQLTEILGGYPLKLVVLNACRSGRVSEGDQVETVLPNALQKAGIPAVVAMAYNLYADAASYFVGHFYDRLASGHNVVDSVHAARTAMIHQKDRHTPFGSAALQDWWVPVIYMNASTAFKPAVATATEESLAQLADPGGSFVFEYPIYRTLRALLERRTVVVKGLMDSGQEEILAGAIALFGLLSPNSEVIGLDPMQWPESVESPELLQGKHIHIYVLNFVEPVDPKVLCHWIRKARGLIGPGHALLIAIDQDLVESFDDVVFITTGPLADDALRHILSAAAVDVKPALSQPLQSPLGSLIRHAGFLKRAVEMIDEFSVEPYLELFSGPLSLDRLAPWVLEMVGGVNARWSGPESWEYLLQLLPNRLSVAMFEQCVSAWNLPKDKVLGDLRQKGLAASDGKVVQFHPLFRIGLPCPNPEMVVRAQQVTLRVAVEMAAAHLRTMDTSRAFVGFRAARLDMDFFQNALILAILSDDGGDWEQRTAQCATLFDLISLVHRREGRMDHLTEFTDYVLSLLEEYRPNRGEGDALLRMKIARDVFPDRFRLQGPFPSFELGITAAEVAVQQYMHEGNFDQAETMVRGLLDQVPQSQCFHHHRLYTLIAQIGEMRGWRVMAYRGRNASISVLENEEEEIPTPARAAQILAEARYQVDCYLAGTRAVEQVTSLDGALLLLKSAEHLFRSLKDKVGILDLQLLHAQIFLLNNKPEQVINPAYRVLETATRIGDDGRRSKAAFLLGNAYLKTAAFDSAELFFLEAEDKVPVNDALNQALILTLLGENALEMGKDAGFVHQYLKKAVETLGRWSQTEAPQAMIAHVGEDGVLDLSGNRMTAFGEILLPSSVEVRLHQVIHKYQSTDLSGTTLPLVRLFARELTPLNPTQQVVSLLGKALKRMVRASRVNSSKLFEIIAIADEFIEPNPFPITVVFLRELGRAVIDFSNAHLMRQAVSLLEKHIKPLSDDQTPNTAEIFLRYTLGQLYMNAGRLKDGLAVFKELWQMVPETDEHAGRIYEAYGSTLWQMTGDESAATEVLRQAMELRRALGQTTEFAEVNLAQITHKGRGPLDAIIPDETKPNWLYGAVAETQTLQLFHALHKTVTAREDPDLLIDYFNALWTRVDDPEFGEYIRQVLMSAASGLTQMDRPEDAVRLLSKLMTLEEPDLIQRQRGYNNLGFARFKMADRTGAQEDLERAFHLLERDDFPKDDLIKSLWFTFANRSNAASSPADQFHNAVRTLALIEKRNSWSQAEDMVNHIRTILRSNPGLSLADGWYQQAGTAIPAKVLDHLGLETLM